LAEKELGFAPSVTFAEGLADTIDWYVANKQWWERIKSGAYREYYKKMYDGR
jgi:dTDP-glucose 4,6-dehydratase